MQQRVAAKKKFQEVDPNMLKDLKEELEAQSQVKDFDGLSDNSKITIILGAPQYPGKKFQQRDRLISTFMESELEWMSQSNAEDMGNFKTIFKKYNNLYTTDENPDNSIKIEGGEGSNTENDSDFRSLIFGLKDNKSNQGGAFLTQYKLRIEKEKALAQAENSENEKQSAVVDQINEEKHESQSCSDKEIDAINFSGEIFNEEPMQHPQLPMVKNNTHMSGYLNNEKPNIAQSVSIPNFDLSDYKDALMESPSIPRTRKSVLKARKTFQTSEEKPIHNPESPSVAKCNAIKLKFEHDIVRDEFNTH